MQQATNETTEATARTYRDAPRIITTAPGEDYRAPTRAFQGIPSLACGPDGQSLFAVWYGGKTPGEDLNNYVMLAVSRDAGGTWSDEQLVIDPDGEGPERAFDPEAWLDPDQRLWIFWAQHDSRDRNRSAVWALTADLSSGAAPQWSAPRMICEGVMMCKPVVLSDGAWGLPVSLWHRRDAGSATLWVSRDRGESWAQQGACDVPPEVRTYDEHMVVERRDGSLWMLVRTLYGIGESSSADGGATWSALEPLPLTHPSSRFFIRRLASGRLLFVRHAPTAEVVAAAEGKKLPRTHLTAFLSEDDGATWKGGLLLDERAGVSYPDGDQAPDGTIHVIYDYSRKDAREILLASFTEEDVLNPPGSERLRNRVNKAERADPNSTVRRPIA